MKIAVLIQCHKNAKQINLLLNKLNHPDIDCYLHIDKKAYFDSLGIQGLRKLEKCQVDVLGNISFVHKEKRMLFN